MLQNKYELTEQWKTDGICNRCRKQSYCKRSCSASNKRKWRIINNEVSNYFYNMMNNWR